jgi:hypothetical protein
MGVTAMPKAYVIAAETISDEAASRSTDPQFLPLSHPSGENLSSVAAISQVWKARGRTRVL